MCLFSQPDTEVNVFQIKIYFKIKVSGVSLSSSENFLNFFGLTSLQISRRVPFDSIVGAVQLK